MLKLYKLLKFLFRHILPEKCRYPLARLIGRLVCVANASRRRVIVENLTPLVGPKEAAAMAPRLLGHFAMTAVDFFCPRRNLAREVQAENAGVLEKSYRRFKKVIVVPEAYVIHAQAPDGSKIVMEVSPDQMQAVIERTGSSSPPSDSTTR